MTNSYELKTASGVIKIADLSDDLLKGIQSYMTYGFMPLGQEVNGAKYGYVVSSKVILPNRLTYPISVLTFVRARNSAAFCQVLCYTRLR